MCIQRDRYLRVVELTDRRSVLLDKLKDITLSNVEIIYSELKTINHELDMLHSNVAAG